VPDDVAKITRWFAEPSTVPHERVLLGEPSNDG
jgi:hypothetical protein